MKKIKEDAQQALKSGDRFLANTLKYLYSLLQTEQARGDKFDPLQVLQKEMKAKKEALKMFNQGGRQDLVDKEKKEIKILERYLPEQMEESEIDKVIKEVLKTIDEPNFGQVMGQVMGKVGSRANGSQVADLVKKKLSKQTS